jgi:secreted trypsin-like serine protease
VVGGAAVPSITAFPFQVALYVTLPPGFLGQSMLAFCGGVIIDPTQVVTAAHCVTDEATGATVAPGAVTVTAGTAVLPPGVPTQPVAAGIAVDPSYNPAGADYDVAVVTFSTPLYTGAPRPDGTVAVAPIPLVTPALAARYADPAVSPALPVAISGWGETAAKPVGAPDVPGPLPQQLQSAATHLVADATCAADYAGLGRMGFPPITTRMICAGEPGGGVDACSGDSGGPLVVDVATPATPPADYVLAGLADFGAGCAQAGFPGVYVRIAAPEITSFIAAQAQAQGQQLSPPPVPPAPVTPAPPAPAPAPAPATTVVVGPGRPRVGTARVLPATVRVRRRVARVAVRCAAARCTGTLTLRSTITLGSARFALAANSTATVSVTITPAAQRQLDRHGHRLRGSASLRLAASPTARRTVTFVD